MGRLVFTKLPLQTTVKATLYTDLGTYIQTHIYMYTYSCIRTFVKIHTKSPSQTPKEGAGLTRSFLIFFLEEGVRLICHHRSLQSCLLNGRGRAWAPPGDTPQLDQAQKGPSSGSWKPSLRSFTNHGRFAQLERGPAPRPHLRPSGIRMRPPPGESQARRPPRPPYFA